MLRIQQQGRTEKSRTGQYNLGLGIILGKESERKKNTISPGKSHLNTRKIASDY